MLQPLLRFPETESDFFLYCVRTKVFLCRHSYEPVDLHAGIHFQTANNAVTPLICPCVLDKSPPPNSMEDSALLHKGVYFLRQETGAIAHHRNSSRRWFWWRLPGDCGWGCFPAFPEGPATAVLTHGHIFPARLPHRFLPDDGFRIQTASAHIDSPESGSAG